MDYDRLGVRHFRDLAQLNLREIAPDEADVAPAVALLILVLNEVVQFREHRIILRLELREVRVV